MDLRGLTDMGQGAPGWCQTDWDPTVAALDDVEMDRPVDQAMVEYMADLYAEEGVVWCPWLKEKGPRTNRGMR